MLAECVTDTNCSIKQCLLEGERERERERELTHPILIAPHIYIMSHIALCTGSLTASKGQQLLGHMSLVKDQQVSKMKEELRAKLQEMTSLSDHIDQQQRELEMMHQKGKSIVNDADSDDYYLGAHKLKEHIP